MQDLIDRYSSRKFLVAMIATTIVFLDAFGAANFAPEVRGAAASALTAYIVMEGGNDIADRRKSDD